MENEARGTAQSHTSEMSYSDQAAGFAAAQNDAPMSQPLQISSHFPQERQHNVMTEHSSLDMTNVTAALPNYPYRQMPPAMYQQQYAHPSQSLPVSYPYPSAQYASAMHNNYSVQFAPHMNPHGYPSQRMFTPYPVNSNMGTVQHMYPGQPFFPQQPKLSSSPQNPFSTTSHGQNFGQISNPMYGSQSPGQYRGTQIRVDGFGNPLAGNQVYVQNETPSDLRKDSTSSLKVPSTLRGPPRKPKQSGHALWVGNLPPGTNIMDLKDHFSCDATEDIESVFLISKSNCAFVNYKGEQSCTAAMARFHDSRFNGVRLVCRLRRGSSPTSTTVPAGMGVGLPTNSLSDQTLLTARSSTQEQGRGEEAEENIQVQTKVEERYFIIKSLTMEDLERSVHSGIWATQSHNEETLNRAFQTAESVYLVFSANKSGEYSGYARMDSAIDSESAATVEVPSVEVQTPQQPSNSSVAELPLTIPTPATATAPKGYIIDDSARGTIFWEAESVALQADLGTSGQSPANTDSGNVSGEESSEQQPKSPINPDSPNPSTTFGKPFKITWMSTERLPFYRTRGLRNPWNNNREVKIARDGTEIEPSVGKKLVAMFGTSAPSNRSQHPSQYSDILPGQGPTYRSY